MTATATRISGLHSRNRALANAPAVPAILGISVLSLILSIALAFSVSGAADRSGFEPPAPGPVPQPLTAPAIDPEPPALPQPETAPAGLDL